MPLSPGTTLGPYEIVAPIGQGGMGIVYKARDTRLNRFVAIKVLPAANVADVDRRRRFVQEAQAASALNHPNIVTIHDIGTSDGTDYIAMEYVPGKTLDALIPRKGMRLNEVLRIGIQIAAGLERAHAAGIVHRDLKPGNIMLAEDGTVKVLDFGLAKLAEPASISEDAQTETVKPQTKEGSILGTVGYMSPEQAEAKPVDARSDIFSFGSILYEMVTGERAFHGDSKLSTLAAILKEQPKPASTVVPDVPRDLERIINRCLRKDPDRRYQHIDEVRLALLEVKEESDSGLPAGEMPVRRRNSPLWAVLALALVAAGAGGFWYWQRGRNHAPPLRITPLTTYQGLQRDPALSPDGRQVAFSWPGENGNVPHIYVKFVESGAPLQLTNEPETADRYPAWSPDGRYLAFYRKSPQGNEVLSISALGGSARKLGPAADLPEWLPPGLSWSPDAKWLAVCDRTDADLRTISLVSLETGERHSLGSPPQGFRGDRYPRFSPDGRYLAFIRDRSDANSDLYLVRYSDGQVRWDQLKKLTNSFDDLRGFDWTPAGRNLICAGADHLWTVSLGGGEPRTLSVPGEAVTGVSVARSGRRLVYQRRLLDSNIWRMPGPVSHDGSESPSRLLASTRFDIEPQYSPDGTKIVFTSERSGTGEIWVADSTGHNEVPLTSFGGPSLGSPRWSPDGRFIAFDCAAPGVNTIYVVGAEGGKPRRLTNDPASAVRPSWSRDGRSIYFGSDRSGTFQIWKMPVSGGTAVQVTHAGGEEAFESMDGKYLYWAKQGKAGLWRMPVAGGEETLLLPGSGESLFGVAPPGLWFFDIAASGAIQLKYLDEATARVTTFRELPTGTQIDTIDTALSMSPDRRWILYTQIDQAGSNLVLVDNFR
jgi:Tol biopolymer transport system component